MTEEQQEKRPRGRPRNVLPKVKQRTGNPKGIKKRTREFVSNPDNIKDSSPDYWDSPLTWDGKPRKMKYPRNAKKRTIKPKAPYVTKKMRDAEVKEAQLRLMSFAPMHTSLYTFTAGSGQRDVYYYMQVWACVDNRIYNITKLVSKVLQLPLLKTRFNFIPSNSLRYKHPHTKQDNKDKKHILIEDELIKKLSMKMFDIDNAYLWQSIYELFPFDVEKPKVEKNYTQVKEIKQEPQKVEKNFRLR